MSYDILVVGDFRFPGGTSTAIAHEVRALAGAGYRIGMVNVKAPVLKLERALNGHIQACLERGEAELITGDEPVDARLTILHNPYAFTVAPAAPPIRAKQAVMVMHQAPQDTDGVPYYDVASVHAVASDLVGCQPIWAPISPLSRDAMTKAGADVEILDEDWANIFFVEEWAVERSSPVADKPVIGRHSRPDPAKWPANLTDMFAAYPTEPWVDVRFLGVGPQVRQMIGPPPANWSLLEFGEMEPREFLRGIDFFVYFHRPDLIESFGRTIAEAIASGAVAILPEHFRATFGEAALYRRPDQVAETVRSFHADWELYQLQSRMGQRFIAKHFGPDPYLKRVARLIGASDETGLPTLAGTHINSAFVTDQLPAPNSEEPRSIECDIAIVGDFRSFREWAWRVAHQIRIQAEAGFTSVLIPVGGSEGGETAIIHPEITACLRDGAAVAANPSATLVRTKLLLIEQPHRLFNGLLAGEQVATPRVIADQTVAVLDRSPFGNALAFDLKRKDTLLKSLFGNNLRWTLTNQDLLREFEFNQPDVNWERDIWRPSIATEPYRERHRLAGAPPVIGRASPTDLSQWPADAIDIRQIYPTERGITVRVLGAPGSKFPLSPLPVNWETFSPEDISAEKFLKGLDFLVYYPGEKPSELPVTLIAWAMTLGVPAILPPILKPIFGQGPIYAKPTDVADHIARLHKDREARQGQCAATARMAREAFGPMAHCARLNRYLSAPDRKPLSMPWQRQGSQRRVLFLSSNGVGLGHLTRLLAVARRCDPGIVPVFATMSQAIQVIEQAGFPAEYIPFSVYSGCNPNDWNQWFGEHLGQVVDFYDPAAVVFDGSNPYHGLLKAVARRRDCSLVWMRRGMWRQEQHNGPLIERQRFFDLIIEPSDIAEARDSGATAIERSRTLKVEPIRLLDPDEVLAREQAAAEIGLDPSRPSVLIQLGAGANRDIVRMTDIILERLAEHPEVQPVIAEWLISPNKLDLWPEVKRLRGFPISRHFSAFDFTISAAGYNSFNEIISFGLPAIFVANDQPMMDNQGGRAEFAQEHGAALRVHEDKVDEIGPYIEAMLDERARWLMRANCGRIARPNGAAEAAEALARLVA